MSVRPRRRVGSTLPIFRAMRQGAEYPEAHETARALAAREASRIGLREGTEAHRDLFARMVPPYDVGKFPNRWWKLEPEQPVRTLMAHIGKDTYSHIHWDSEQARTISVREAARLQGFPDGFVFEGTMNPAFRQIGNAVAPLMAAAPGVRHCGLTMIRQPKMRRIGSVPCPSRPMAESMPAGTTPGTVLTTASRSSITPGRMTAG